MTFFMEVEPPVATLPERSPAAEAATEEAAVLEAAEEEAVLLEEQPLRVSALTVAVAAISAIKFLLVIFIYFSFQMRSF